MSDTEKPMILGGLEPLFEEAERDGKWFFCNYQQLWLSPKELREYQNEGRFCWSAENWKLRKPKERLLQLENDVLSAESAVENFRARMTS